MYMIKINYLTLLLHFLNKSKEALQYFAQNDIIYGDVNNRNLLINPITGEVKFCDIDNIRLGQFPIDILDWELERYIPQTKMGFI